MIRSNPFNLWPLHVKLFTEEARDVWNAHLDRKSKADNPLGCLPEGKDPPPPTLHHPYFPPGFTWTVELEGVDGASGHPKGSGRTIPLIVTDDDFTSVILAKKTLLSSGESTGCVVCGDPVDLEEHGGLNATLCTHDGCLATSHLLCLSSHFLNSSSGATQALSDTLPPSSITSEVSSSSAGPIPPYAQQSTFIPRGGNCPSCSRYTLWGDIVRGIYRRVKASSDPEARDLVAAANAADESEPDDLFRDDSDVEEAVPTPKKRKSSSKARSTGKGKQKASEGEDTDDGVRSVGRRKTRKTSSAGVSESASGESFALDVTDSGTDEELLLILGKKPKTPKGKRTTTRKTKEPLDDDETPVVKRRPGRPRSKARTVEPPPPMVDSEDDMFLEDSDIEYLGTVKIPKPNPSTSRKAPSTSGATKAPFSSLSYSPIAGPSQPPAFADPPRTPPPRSARRLFEDDTDVDEEYDPANLRSRYGPHVRVGRSDSGLHEVLEISSSSWVDNSPEPAIPSRDAVDALTSPLAKMRIAPAPKFALKPGKKVQTVIVVDSDSDSGGEG